MHLKSGMSHFHSKLDFKKMYFKLLGSLILPNPLKTSSKIVQGGRQNNQTPSAVSRRFFISQRAERLACVSGEIYKAEVSAANDGLIVLAPQKGSPQVILISTKVAQLGSFFVYVLRLHS